MSRARNAGAAARRRCRASVRRKRGADVSCAVPEGERGKGETRSVPRAREDARGVQALARDLAQVLERTRRTVLRRAVLHSTHRSEREGRLSAQEEDQGAEDVLRAHRHHRGAPPHSRRMVATIRTRRPGEAIHRAVQPPQRPLRSRKAGAVTCPAPAPPSASAWSTNGPRMEGARRDGKKSSYVAGVAPSAKVRHGAPRAK